MGKMIEYVEDIDKVSRDLLYEINGAILDTTFDTIDKIKDKMQDKADKKIKTKPNKLQHVIEDGIMVNTTSITTTHTTKISMLGNEGKGGYLRMFGASMESPRETGLRTRRRKGRISVNETGNTRMNRGILPNINAFDEAMNEEESKFVNKLETIINNAK